MILLFAFIFGLIIGSFLNCLVWRLYKGESLWGRSYCPLCRRPIAWYDNVPLLSFIFLGGRCRQCRQKISWQYPLVELATGLLFGGALLNNLGGWGVVVGTDYFELLFKMAAPRFYLNLLRDYFIIATMIVVFLYDLRWYLISNAVIIPAAAVIFILNLLLGFSWYNSILFAIISSSFFLLQFIITKRRGIGEGDIWLGFLLGLIFPALPLWWLAIIVAYFLGALVGLLLLLGRKKKWGSKLPLGVFLATATILVLLYGQPLIDAYLTQLF